MTAGLGCDGDSVSITAATQPSIEDVMLGAIPGLPKVHLHNPVLAYEVGDDFMKYWYHGRGRASWIPSCWWSKVDSQREDQEGRLLGGASAPIPTPASRSPPTNGSTGWRPRHWRWSPPAPAPPTAASTPWKAIPPAAWGWPIIWAGIGRSKAGLPIVNVPGCPVQPDNFMETLLYLLYQVAGLAPMIPLDDQLRPTWLFGKTVHEGCDRAGYYEQGDFAEQLRLAEVHREAGLLGSGGELQRAQARLDGGHRRLPQRGRHLHRLHHARLPRQVHAVHGRAAGRADVSTGAVGVYGRAIRRAARHSPIDTVNKEPKWRHPRAELTTGYRPEIVLV